MYRWFWSKAWVMAPGRPRDTDAVVAASGVHTKTADVRASSYQLGNEKEGSAKSGQQGVHRPRAAQSPQSRPGDAACSRTISAISRRCTAPTRKTRTA